MLCLIASNLEIDMKKMIGVLLGTFGLFSVVACASAEDQSAEAEYSTLRAGPVEFQSYILKRGDKPSVQYYISKTREPAPLVLFIQGSGCSPVFIPGQGGSYASTVYNFIPLAATGKVAMMVVKKPLSMERAGPSGTANSCPQEFNEYFTAENWSRDVNLALDHALKRPWIKSGGTLIVGVSEGATIASMIAGTNRKVSHVALIGASGPTQFYDFIVSAYRSSSSDKEAKAKLEDLEITRKKIFDAPDSSVEFAWGHPYKRWTSFFRNSSTQHLLRSSASIYIVSGMQDKNVPILSTESMASELVTAGHNVTLRRIPTANHILVPEGGSWADSDPEYYRILDWFGSVR